MFLSCLKMCNVMNNFLVLVILQSCQYSWNQLAFSDGLYDQPWSLGGCDGLTTVCPLGQLAGNCMLTNMTWKGTKIYANIVTYMMNSLIGGLLVASLPPSSGAVRLSDLLLVTQLPGRQR